MDYLDGDRFSDAELEAFGADDRHVDSVDYSTAAFLSVAYGVTGNLLVGMTLPHLYQDDIRESHESGPGVGEAEFEGDSSGLGDLQLFGMYRFFGEDESPLQASALFGLELPTGRTNDKNVEGEKFELEHQAGSGSWDPSAGVALSGGHESWSFHASLLYTLVTDGKQDTDLGDRLRYDVAAVYRAWEAAHDHASHDHGAHGTAVDTVLELNGSWEDKHDVSGSSDPESGGNAIYLSPGLRLTLAGKWSLFVSYGIPIVQDLKGANHETDYRLTAGVSVTR